MTQNRNKLIELFIANISNAIVHEILEKAIDVEEIVEKYGKEIKTSFDIARTYREKINPTERALPLKDIKKIRKKVINTVRAELQSRISKGYQNINLNLIEPTINKILKETKVI